MQLLLFLLASNNKNDYCVCFYEQPLRARELKELKCFSVDDDKTLMSWKMAVRIAKVINIFSKVEVIDKNIWLMIFEVIN